MMNLTGQRFGRLTVITEAPMRSQYRRVWICQCNCGNVTTVQQGNLRRGHTQSCGCFQSEVRIGPNTTIERFEAKYIPVTETGCWLWIGGHYRNGYGTFTMPHRTSCKAHRASWVLHNGSIPEDLQVLHKCDVRACVNPNHLFLGTNADNRIDCVKKGRMNHPARLTVEQVKEIRSMRASGVTTQILSDKFQISAGYVRAIVLRRNWAHV